MSNLGQAATIVGQRLGVDTSSASTRDGAAVRAFLTSWHNTLWRSYLWKDSILEFVMPFPGGAYGPTSNYMPTKNRIVYPPIIEQVLGLRFNCRSLNVQRPMFYYRANLGRFFQSGYVAEFELLSACVWEFDTVQTLGINNANVGDNNLIATLDELQTDAVTIQRNQYALNSNGVAIQNTDRIDNFIKPSTQGNVWLGPLNGPLAPIGNNLVPNGTTYQVAGTSVIGGLTPGASYQVTFGANEVQFAPSSTFINGSQNTPMAANGQVVNFVAQGASVTFSALQPLGTPVTATLFLLTASASQQIILLPTQTEAPKSQRVQLVGKPNNPQQMSETLYTLGKRAIPTYVSDSDVPGVVGFTEILIPLAYYFFKNRDEQGGSADAIAALSEGVGPEYLTKGIPGGLLKTLIRQEVEQAAYNTRIIPQDGFGTGWGYGFEDKSHPYSNDWGY